MTILSMNRYYKNKDILDNAGFSLLEILIAVAILATSLVSLMAAQGGAFLSSERADSVTKATFLARQKMAEVQIELQEDLDKNKFPDSELEKEGTFDEPYDDYRWAYTLKKVEIPMVEGAPAADSGEGDGKQAASADNPMVGNYMQQVMDQISKSVREVKVIVYWGDKETKKEDQQQMAVTSHIVKMQ